MRKLIWLMHMSLNGMHAGPNGELDWIQLDDEMFDDVHQLSESADAAVYGRVTYQLMAAYWPTAGDSPAATKHDKEHSAWANAATKLVFSRTLEKVDWKNSRLIRENVAEEMAAEKRRPGKNLLMLGSAGLASTLMNLGFIDDFWLNVNPVVLDRGLPLFRGLKSAHNLKLVDSKTYKSGVVRLRYAKA